MRKTWKNFREKSEKWASFIEKWESFREKGESYREKWERVLETCAAILEKDCVNFIYIRRQKL